MADEKSVKSVAKNAEQQQTVANRKSAGANWSAVNGNNKENGNHEESQETATTTTTTTTTKKSTQTKNKLAKRKRAKWGNRHVAMDCEMVGIFNGRHEDMLARVSIVNRHGNVLLDKYVKPTAEVFDYRTQVSGIRPQDIENGEDFKVVQAQVIEILDGKMLVGHGLRKDLQVLKITHPVHKIRDTATYKALGRVVGCGRTPSLKRLAHCLLGEQIQTGEHDSVEDAKAAMNIYNVICDSWEEAIQNKYR